MHLARSSVCSLLLTTLAAAQIGGDGRDGPYSPTSSTTLDTARGPYYFTTFNIPAGVTVTCIGPNPVVLFATSTVTIAGTLNADGGSATSSTGGAGGPAGTRGGNGGNGASARGADGTGLGGGGGATAVAPFYAAVHGGGAGHSVVGLEGGLRGGRAGGVYGQVLPHDPRGGSGGGGGAALSGIGYGGGGGGGVIVIHADLGITISATGVVTARGGDIVRTDAGNTNNAWGGGGSGGSIWIRSLSSLSLATGSQVRADGGVWSARTSTGTWSTPSGGNGFVRLEAYGVAPTVSGTVVPNSLTTRYPALFNVTAARLTMPWEMGCTAAPNDLVGFLLGAGNASVAFPPYGTIALNTALPILVLGNTSAGTGLEPIARLAIPVPNDPALVNRALYTQALNLTTVTGRPRLSNGVTTTVTN